MVWAPDLKKLRTQGAWWGALGSLHPVADVGIVVLMWIVCDLVKRMVPIAWFLVSFLLFLAFSASLLAIQRASQKAAGRKRPCYLSTDDTGIGVTTIAGTAYFRWDEIVRVGFDPTTVNLTLRLANGESRELHLLGYSKAQMDALVCLVRERSEISSDLTQEGLWKSNLRSGSKAQVLRSSRRGRSTVRPWATIGTRLLWVGMAWI